MHRDVTIRVASYVFSITRYSELTFHKDHVFVTIGVEELIRTRMNFHELDIDIAFQIQSSFKLQIG